MAGFLREQCVEGRRSRVDVPQAADLGKGAIRRDERIGIRGESRCRENGIEAAESRMPLEQRQAVIEGALVHDKERGEQPDVATSEDNRARAIPTTRSDVRELLDHLDRRSCADIPVADGVEQSSTRLCKWVRCPDGIEQDRRVQDDQRPRARSSSSSAFSSSGSGMGIGSAARIASAAARRAREREGYARSMASRINAPTESRRRRDSASRRSCRSSSRRIWTRRSNMHIQ
jgi:hypothetical protein